MKVLFVIWMLMTMLLALSVIGWILLIPKQNDTGYFMSAEKTRSTWMSLGYSMFNKINQ